MSQPDRIKIGGGLILVSLDGLARDWGVTEKAVRSMVAYLKLKVITFPDHPKKYINLWSFEQGLFDLTLPDAMKGNVDLARLCRESAALIYGTLTKEVIRDRVKKLARSMRMGASALTKDRKRTKMKRGG